MRKFKSGLFLLLAALTLAIPLAAVRGKKAKASSDAKTGAKAATSACVSKSSKKGQKAAKGCKTSTSAPKAKFRPVRVSAKARAAALQSIEQALRTPLRHPVEQPEALTSFFSQLRGLEEHSGPSSLHVLHFGDSHTAADEFTGQLRTLFQERFGNGGAGFSLAGYPFLGYRIHGTKRAQSSGWNTLGTHFRNLDDIDLGLGGVAISTDRAGQFVTLQAEAESVELQFLQQPGGGEIDLYNGDHPLTSISTDGTGGPGAFAVTTDKGEHQFEVRTLGNAPVRLLGWVTQNSTGITYEALGINGAEASLILRWNETLHSYYLQRREPALIVLAYGTNEASNKDWTYDAYREMFRTLITRLQRTVPKASILVLGPGDRYIRVRGAGWKRFDGSDHIIRAQREVCRELGCAYWDWQQRMGGAGSMRQWAYAQWTQADYTHFTQVGYHELANTLYADLMAAYKSYRLHAPPAPEPSPTPQETTEP